jgi:putative ABC transport system permease protein
VTLPQDTYRTPAQWRSLAHELRARLEEQAGVESVGFGVGVPLTSPAVRVPIAVAGMPVIEAATKPTTDLVEAGTTYFSTIGIPMLGGRAFGDADRDTAPTVGIVNATFVRRFLDSGRDPVGQHVRLGAKAAPLEIVGVVGDTAQSSISTPAPPVLYLAFDQRPFWVVTFAIRTRDAGVPVAKVFQAAVASLAPAAPVVSVDSLQSLIDRTTAPSNHRTLVVGLLGLLALVLSGVGIYGIVAYSVAQRTREVGVRLALGAEPGGIRRLVLTQGTRLAATGIGLGLLLSRLTMPLLSALLFQVTTTDPVTLVAGPAVLALTAIAACYVPARRATRIDPIVALRSE